MVSNRLIMIAKMLRDNPTVTHAMQYLDALHMMGSPKTR